MESVSIEIQRERRRMQECEADRLRAAVKDSVGRLLEIAAQFEAVAETADAQDIVNLARVTRLVTATLSADATSLDAALTIMEFDVRTGYQRPAKTLAEMRREQAVIDAEFLDGLDAKHAEYQATLEPIPDGAESLPSVATQPEDESGPETAEPECWRCGGTGWSTRGVGYNSTTGPCSECAS